MESKIKVGNFIQLPANNFKPSRKKVVKSPLNLRKSIQNSQLQQQQKQNSSTANKSSSLRSSLNKSEHKPVNQVKLSALDETIKQLNNEEKEKKLNEFVNKIKSVFNAKMIELKYKKQIINEQVEKEICSVTPPFEWFIQDQIDLELRKKKFFNYLEENDYLIGHLVINSLGGLSKSNKSDTKKATFKVICFDGSKRRVIHDLGLQAYYLIDNDETNNPVSSELNTENEGRYFRFRVHKVIKEQIFVIFNHSTFVHDNLHLYLGLISYDDLPEHFRIIIRLTQETWPRKPNPFAVDYLLETLQINEENAYRCSKIEKRTNKIDDDLRSGIDCLRKEQYDKAELYLKSVIREQPRNTDARVARGCVLANQSNYSDAILEFEIAIKLDDKHLNAKKYLTDVLLAYGKSLTKHGELRKALENYERVLSLDSANRKAKDEIKAIKLINSEEKRKKSRKRSKSPHSSSSKRQSHRS